MDDSSLGHHSQVNPNLSQPQIHNAFWEDIMNDIYSTSESEFKTYQLPLARIKKIMKTDEEVKGQMISQEAPVIFAKACEIFIRELTIRSWIHTEENKRKTLQRNDIISAISDSDMYDFLIDIVPREEMKTTKVENTHRHAISPELQHYYYQMAQTIQSNSIVDNQNMIQNRATPQMQNPNMGSMDYLLYQQYKYLNPNMQPGEHDDSGHQDHDPNY